MLENQSTIAADPIFQKRVRAALYNIARTILNRPRENMPRSQWTKRAALAANILTAHFNGSGWTDGVDIWLGVFSGVIAVYFDSVLDQSEIEDSDIRVRVMNSWDSIAGVTGRDLL